jgi:uncharacterized protein YhbP (UPF0306 family)
MRLNPVALSIIKRTEYATLATVDQKGYPWNAPVYCAFDQNYNFYWGSHKDSQHSINIRENGRVFLAIYNSTVAPGQGEGVYIQAACTEIDDPTAITAAHTLIQDRRAPIPYWKLEQFTDEDSPIRLYKATLEHIWINGEGSINSTYIDTRVSAEQ